MEETKISIIIPVYNGETYLKETLESVVEQDFDGYEVIIMDDGSTDHTIDILEEYEQKYPNLIHVYHQKNAGQSAARNHALQYVSGKYTGFVDADDILEKDYLSRLYKMCQDDVEIAICSYQKFVTETKEVVTKRNAKKWNAHFKDGASHVFHYTPCAKLFLTSFLKKYEIMFSEGEQLEDCPYGIMTHILADGIAVSDYYGYRYRIHSESTMGNVRKTKSSPKMPFKGMETAVKQVKKYKNDKVSQNILEYCVVKALAGMTTEMYKDINEKSRKELCEYCYYLIEKYFPKFYKNPHISFMGPKEIPFVHRGAIIGFMWAYRLKLLYPFSLVVSKLL